jgi:ABC-type uncharacterized transport system substrate-binding protein
MLLSRHTRRREFIAGLGAAASLSAWPVAAQAQQRNQIKRIAYVAAGSAETLITPIKRELAKLGWVEGHNMRIEALLALDRRVLRAAAPFVVSSAPDLIVVISTEAAQIFKEATDTIPIVFAFVADPIASDLVKSFARPGGNLTGFTAGRKVAQFAQRPRSRDRPCYGAPRSRQRNFTVWAPRRCVGASRDDPFGACHRDCRR